MRSRALVLALALAAAASPAFAGDDAPRVRDVEDTWRVLARPAEAEVAEREYDRAMLEGDEGLDIAVASEIRQQRKNYVDKAVKAYELAASAIPTAAEPHFRAAEALHAFFIDCNPHDPLALCRREAVFSGQARGHAERVIKHWNAFEAKAPRDPRLVDDILFKRAILHTKLATPEHLALARADYLKLISLRSPHAGRADSLAVGNLAETEMMLGNLENAIVRYERTLELDQSISYYFGLAVALDRDEQGHRARSILRMFGLEGVRQFERMIADDDVFYVPAGEAYYYLALGYESIGIDDAALRYYDLFLASGAHPQYAPRARANRAAIAQRRTKRVSDERGKRQEFEPVPLP